MQRDTEVTHRVVRGRTEINCDLKENQSQFSEKSRLKELAKKHSERTPEREPHYTLCDIGYTSKDGCTQTKLTPE